MDIDVNIFKEKGKFFRFIKSSTLQYIKLKFGNKKNLISFIKSNFGIKISKTTGYDKIDKVLRENSKDFYRDILGVESSIEIAHLYSFYKVLTDIFFETTWSKNFSPIYNFLFNERIKIKEKSKLREYAAKIITKFNQKELAKKWIELTSSGEYKRYRLVIHYKHLTVGPLGFLFSLYYREKEMFGGRGPILVILVNMTPTGASIADWKKTDALKVFSSVLKGLNKKISEVTSKYPAYDGYLTSIGFEFSYMDWKKELPNFVKSFKDQIKEDKISLMFYQIVQLSAMFFRDEEIIDLLNKLMAENKLIIHSEAEIEDLKITTDGIIKRPRSWLARPAFELARDIASIEPKSSEEALRATILKDGAIKYLEETFDNSFGTFKLICVKKGLYKFASLDRSNLPKNYAIRSLLESYGLLTPPLVSFDIRKQINSLLKKLGDFKADLGIKKELEDFPLVDKMSTLLEKGRTCFERLLKEWLYIIISLILHYEDSVSKGSFKDIFILDRPIFSISRYGRERELDRVKKRYREFLGKLGSSKDLKISEDLKNKISKYTGKEKIEFGLYDWYFLMKLSTNYIKKNYKHFCEDLPAYLCKSINAIFSEIKNFFFKEQALKWLNIGSHEESMVKLRKNIDNRREALNVLSRLDEKISSVLQNLPELIIITKKVTEARTGLECYEAERISDKSVLTIYGIRFIELEFLYYLIPRFEEKEDIITYPILITDLIDSVF